MLRLLYENDWLIGTFFFVHREGNMRIYMYVCVCVRVWNLRKRKWYYAYFLVKKSKTNMKNMVFSRALWSFYHTSQSFYQDMHCNMRKCTFGRALNENTELCSVWSESSLPAWRNLRSLARQGAQWRFSSDFAQACLSLWCVHISEGPLSDVKGHMQTLIMHNVPRQGNRYLIARPRLAKLVRTVPSFSVAL